MKKLGNGSNGGNGGNGKPSREDIGRPSERAIRLSERRRVVVQLRIREGLSFREVSERLPGLGFKKVRLETCWNDYRMFLKHVAERVDTTEQLGEILTNMREVLSLALKAYATAEQVDRVGNRFPDGQAQAALLGQAREMLSDMAKLCGRLKPEQYEHKHSGTLSLIDEIAAAEREVGKVKSLPGVR
jgi:hypothetical protein